MIEIKGGFSTALIYTDTVEETAAEQIELLCSQPFSEGSKIRVMPDVHAGKGCVIGFTADLGEMVIPNIVGVDIGCGMLTVKLGRKEIDFEKLDSIINDCVPSGYDVHKGRIQRFPKLTALHCYRSLNDAKRIERSIGTLGGGNHFIEIDADDDSEKYLVIHTGSRNLGKQVAEYYQTLAFDCRRGLDKLFERQTKLIAEYKAQGRKSEIQEAIKQLKKEYRDNTTDIPKELCYLTGEYRQMYLDDMGACQEFAVLNRRTIAEIILEKLFGAELTDFESFETIHNYIDLKNNIVRKGAVSAERGELLLVPINMRDGSLICEGKGNADWNCSAPHGAGRLMSRGSAREKLSLEEYKRQMNGIYSTCICESTIDESPMAYKSMNEILSQITPTAEVIKHIKPVYNFKAI